MENDFNFQLWITELLSMNESLTTDDIVELLAEYLSDLSEVPQYLKRDTVYRKLKRLAKAGTLIQNNADYTSWWALPIRDSVVKDWDFYIKWMQKENHYLLKSISKKDGGLGKGNGLGWAMRRFLVLMKEVHN